MPTFRQCFNHTSGLAGHGDFGGMRNPHLENVILNGIDVNEPNVKYAYSGLGFELAAKAMELVAGKSAVRLYDEHLFRPLGFGDVPIGNASSDGEFTARELAILAQWVANRGSYGPWEFIAPQTFDQLLPEPLRVPDHGFVEDEGLGLHWIRHVKPGAPRTPSAPKTCCSARAPSDTAPSPAASSSSILSSSWSSRKFANAAAPAAPSGRPGSSKPSPPQSKTTGLCRLRRPPAVGNASAPHETATGMGRPAAVFLDQPPRLLQISFRRLPRVIAPHTPPSFLRWGIPEESPRSTAARPRVRWYSDPARP